MPHQKSLKAQLIQIAAGISNRLRSVSEIGVTDVISESANDIVLIDVRPEVERTVSVIPGSISIKEFECGPARFGSQKLVAYCTAGYRSGLYAQHMQQQSIQINNLRGGILSWCQHQQPLQTLDGNVTHRVHVYGKRWNLVEPPYEGVW